jgi:hypothetical protein
MNGNTALSWEEDRLAKPWQRHLTLPGLLALGWLVFEATSQPALGVVIVCVKFGWNDLLTAYWLRMRDPEPERGWACFWLYLTSAFWKMGVGAFVLCFVLGMIQLGVEMNNPGAQGGFKEAIAVINQTALVVVLGFAFATVLALCTLWQAWQTGFKLWLNPNAHRARWRNCWPTELSGPPGNNWAETVLPVTFIFFLLAMSLFILDRFFGQAKEFAIFFAAALTFIPAIILGLRRPLFGWALAKNPDECFGDGQRATGHGQRANYQQ